MRSTAPGDAHPNGPVSRSSIAALRILRPPRHAPRPRHRRNDVSNLNDPKLKTGEPRAAFKPAPRPWASVVLSHGLMSLAHRRVLGDGEQPAAGLLVLHSPPEPLQYGVVDGLYNGFAIALFSSGCRLSRRSQFAAQVRRSRRLRAIGRLQADAAGRRHHLRMDPAVRGAGIGSAWAFALHRATR